MIHIPVSTAKPYTVTIGAGLLRDCGKRLREVVGVCRVLLVTDSHVEPLYAAPVVQSLQNAGYDVSVITIPAGERSKNMENLSLLLERMAELRLTRSDCIVALGGGVVGDLAGFAAGCFLRGIRFVQLPTTMLAMVDSSVGGKTAVNLTAGKNLAGLFWQPSAVICDTDCLKTLPKDIFLQGAVEAVKAAVLEGDGFFSLMEDGALEHNKAEVIARSVAHKARLVAGDEREAGLRKLLNLGHTIGHAVERCSDYTVSHGSAVSVGLAYIIRAAVQAGDCGADAARRILGLLESMGLSTQTETPVEQLYQAALGDKKRAGDTVTLVWPRGIGNCVLRDIPVAELRGVIQAGQDGAML